MSTKRTILLGAAALGLTAAAPAQAVVILAGPAGWNLTNVVEGAPVAGTTDESASVVYDRDVTGGTAGANTYGRIACGGGESQEPGIKVMNGPDQGGFPTVPELDAASNASNCIMASSYTYCDGPMQTGKRFKQQMTGIGPIDLVFNVDASEPDTETEYRVFQRLVNRTGVDLGGFVLELGFGVGSGFAASGLGDGLSLSPRDEQNPTQFPFGLFGAPTADRPLGGFFDATERALFDTVFAEDPIQTAGLLGSYDYYFEKGWVSQEQAPDGVLFDHDNDASTDVLVMAFLNEKTGKWEVRRTIDGDGEVVTLVADPTVRGDEYDSAADAIAALLGLPGAGVLAGDLGSPRGLADLGDLFDTGPIEDVANLAVNYFIQVAMANLCPTFDTGTGQATFTMRVTPFASDSQVIPLPAAAPLLMAGIGGLLALRRRRRAA